MNAWNSAEYDPSTSGSAAYASAYAQYCDGANQLSPIVHNNPESDPSTTSAHSYSGTYGCHGSGANELNGSFTSALQSQISNRQSNADGMSQFSQTATSVPGWEGSQPTPLVVSSNLLDQAVAKSVAGAHYFAAPQTADSLINQYQYAATINTSLGNQQQQQQQHQNYAALAPAGLPQQGLANLQQQQQTNSFLTSNASNAAIGEFDALNSSVTYDHTQHDSVMGATRGQMMVGLPTLPAQGDHQEDPGWEAQFRVLSKWRIEKGHCKIPARCQENPRLGRWVMTQRRQYVLLRNGKPSAMTQSRIDRLNSIDFSWSIRPEPLAGWANQYKQLLAFFHKNGHCIVPQRYEKNPQLGTWVHTQRRQYKLKMDGRKSSMTQEKINLLNNIKFEWDGKRKKGLSQKR